MKENITKQNNEKFRVNDGVGENDSEGGEGQEVERGNKNIWKFDSDEIDDEDENERGRGHVSRIESMRRQSNRGYQGNVSVVGCVGGDGDGGKIMSVSLNERYVIMQCMIQYTILCISHTISFSLVFIFYLLCALFYFYFYFFSISISISISISLIGSAEHFHLFKGDNFFLT